MIELEEETKYAREKINSSDYKERIQELESNLHGLRSDLAEAEKEILQDKGYKPVNIDDFTIMVPLGMTLHQLQAALQQISPPKEGRERAVKNLVDREDRSAVHEHEKYQNVVSKRQEIIDEVMDVYKEFWDKEVKDIAETEDEQIAYLMAGLEKNIRSRKLSEITGLPEFKCRKYDFNEDLIVKQDE